MYKTNSQYALIVIFCLSLSISAQANVFKNLKAELDTVIISIQHSQADKKFAGMAYVDAIKKYENLVEKGFAPDSLRRNLAIAYYKTNNSIKAEELFGQLVVNNEATNQDIYYYVQSLKYNQKYDEADNWMEKYKELDEYDTRGELQSGSAKAVNELKKAVNYKLEPVYFNSKYSEFGAVVLDSQIVFTSGRQDHSIIQYEYSWKGNPYLDIFSTPQNKPLFYRDAKLLTKGLNSRFHDGPICYGPDGNEVFVTRSNFNHGLPKYSENKKNHFLLYHAKRSGLDWGELTPLPFNSKEYSCGHPSISADNTRLYFASDMPGGFGGSDIYYVERIGSSWSAPINMGTEINTEGEEMFPFVDEKGNLYFSSDGRLGIGGLDIFMASKDNSGNLKVINMGYPLNSSADDFSFYLMKNDIYGYIASNREGGEGEDDIYRFEFINKPIPFLKLKGTTRNEETGEILANASINITDSKGEEIYNTKSNENGNFELEVSPDIHLKIQTSKENFEAKEENVFINKEQIVDDIFYVDILLRKEKEWGVFGFIYEKESRKGVDDVEVIITSKDGKQNITTTTDTDGNFRELLLPETDYDILLKKRKFFTKRGEFTTQNMAPGWIDIKEFIEVELEEIVVGKTIEIPNIYYDLAKWDIRTDAAEELNKVVQFLLDNETISIELGSHTDSRGSAASNQTLSQKRAESAVNYIVEHGIDSSRITAKGYGESRLKNKCADGVRCSEEEHQENRRTEIMIVSF